MLFDPLIIAFFGIALGFVLQKRIGFDNQSLANILIFVTGPALVFSAIYSRQIVLREFFVLAIAPIFVMLVSALFALAAYRTVGYNNVGMLLPAAFMNSAYMGFPVTLFALGEAGLQKAILYDAIETILMFSAGVFLAQKASVNAKEKLKEIFRIPLIYAVALGLAFNLVQVPLPSLLIDSLALIGSGTIPLALIALGGRLCGMKVGGLKIPLIAVFSRLAVGGIAGFLFVQLLGLTGLMASVVLLLSVMPPAMNSYVLNEKFGNEPEKAATAVFIGTLLSAIPMAVVLLMI